MKLIRPAAVLVAIVGLVATACGGTAAPTSSPGASTQASAAATTQKLVIGFTASQTGAQNVA